MPGKNGTGPVGAGPMTGRAMGFCVGTEVSGYANAVGGRGCGMGRGRGMGQGRGFGRGFGLSSVAGSYLPSRKITADEELEAIKGQARYFEDSLKEINERLEGLQSRNK